MQFTMLGLRLDEKSDEELPCNRVLPCIHWAQNHTSTQQFGRNGFAPNEYRANWTYAQ